MISWVVKPLMALALAAAVLPSLAHADDLSAEARVDRNMVGVGDRLVLTIAVTGANEVREPDLGVIKGFRIVRSSRSQSINVVNFKMTRALNLQYVLTALEEGDFVLGPFTISTGKQSYETEPVRVKVVKGRTPQGGTPQPDRADEKDLVQVSASVDRTTAYVGQQITHTVKFAYRVQMAKEPSYVPAEHTGFWFEELGSTGPEIETIDGKQFRVLKLRTAYFPISSGRHTIGASRINYTIRETDPFSRDPFSIFSRDPFSLGGREGVGETKPIEIEVLPLPTEGRPESFSGAVGRFNMKVTPSSRSLKTGESLTLTIEISGRGNVKSIGDIAVPEFEDFRVFAPKARASDDVQGLRVGGTKTFDLVLVPQRTGRHVLEGFEFSYFDPDKAEYVTLTSKPIEIEVGEGEEALTGVVPGTAGLVGVARRDIRHIKREEIAMNELRLSSRGVRGLLMRYLPVAVALAGIVVSLQKRRAEVAGKGAVRKAFKATMKELKAAGALAREPARAGDAAGMISRALKSYIAARTGSSGTMVDRDSIASMEAVPEELRSRLIRLIESLDKMRFAPRGSDPGQLSGLVDMARDLTREVDGRWNK